MNNKIKPFQHILPNELLNGFSDKKENVKIITKTEENTIKRWKACGEDYFYSETPNDTELDDIMTKNENFHSKIKIFRKEENKRKNKKVVKKMDNNENKYKDCILETEVKSLLKYLITSVLRTIAIRELFNSLPNAFKREMNNVDIDKEIEKKLANLPKELKNKLKLITENVANHFIGNLETASCSKKTHNIVLSNVLKNIEEDISLSLLINKNIYIIEAEDIILPDTILVCLNKNKEPVIFPDKTVHTLILPISYNKYIMLSSEDIIFEEKELNIIFAKNSFNFFVSRCEKNISNLKKYIGTNKENYNLDKYCK
jgi:hypothetical protein